MDQAGRQGVHANPELRKFTGHGQGHAHDGAFCRAVGHLAHLAFERGNRCGVDDHAADTVIRDRVVQAHLLCRKARHIEGANLVDLHYFRVLLQGQRSPFTESLARGADAGKVIQHMHCTESFHHRVQRLLHRCFTGNIDMVISRFPTKTPGDGLSRVIVQIKNGHRGAFMDITFCRSLAEPGCATGDYGNFSR